MIYTFCMWRNTLEFRKTYGFFFSNKWIHLRFNVVQTACLAVYMTLCWRKWNGCHYFGPPGIGLCVYKIRLWRKNERAYRLSCRISDAALWSSAETGTLAAAVAVTSNYIDRLCASDADLKWLACARTLHGLKQRCRSFWVTPTPVSSFFYTVPAAATATGTASLQPYSALVYLYKVS